MDYVEFKLYHSTTDTFLDSILKYGLGGVNPIEQLNVVQFISYCYHVCKEDIPFDYNNTFWRDAKIIYEPVVNQTITRGGFNFRHGRSYLTANRVVAECYAENEFGSEAITLAAQLYNWVKEYSPSKADALEIQYSPLLDTFQHKGNPIILELENVPIRFLRTEQGGDPTQQISLISNEIDKFGTIVGNHGFELIHPIQKDRICYIYKKNHRR